MTPQRPNAHPAPQAPAPAHPEARINHVLEALRTAAPPAGLEQRIAAHLAQAAEARHSSAPHPRPLITTDIAADPALFATILNAARSPKSIFTAISNAARLLLTVISTGARLLLTVISTAARSAQWRDPRILRAPARLYTAAAALALLITLTTIALTTTPVPRGFSLGSHSPMIKSAGVLTPAPNPTPNTSAAANTHESQASSLDSYASVATTPVPRGFSLGSHSPLKNAGALSPAPNPDTIALAETRAPSHPAPRMPLTAPEHLLLAAARPGQPIEVAELDMARAPILRASAAAREDASIRRYVHTLLAPFAVADALSPTTNSQPQELSPPTPAPQPSTSLTN
jgi:hypothetical protein